MPARPSKRGNSAGDSKSDDKMGFYNRVLDELEKLDFEQAAGLEGIDDEIALLRVKIKSLVGNAPEDLALLVKATNALERLIRTRYNITREQRKGLKEAIGNVLRDVAVPLGIGIGTTIDKQIG